jgi:excisionase family DNA binding protein
LTQVASERPRAILRQTLQGVGRTTDTNLRRQPVVERKTISIMKACELVGVSRRTIYNWLSSGKIEYVRTAGGSVRIFVDTLWRDPNRSDRPAVESMWRAEERKPA